MLDHYLKASIDQADGKHHPETGHYAELIYAGCDTRERAKEIRQALYRSGYHLKVSVMATVEPAKDGTFQVRFRAVNKDHARKFVLDHYGNDSGRWPYQPRAASK